MHMRVVPKYRVLAHIGPMYRATDTSMIYQTDLCNI